MAETIITSCMEHKEPKPLPCGRYESHIGYDLQTRSRPRGLPWLDGVLWQWVLYQNGNWAGESPYYYGTELEARQAGRRKIRERTV